MTEPGLSKPRRDLPPILAALVRAAMTILGSAATLLPRRLELALGPFLGHVFLISDFRRRRIARDNIGRCLPELDETARARLLRENYEHYGVLALELCHMLSPVAGHYRRYASRIAVLEGFENWKKAHDKGKGVLFVSAHLANWEMMAAMGAMHGMPLTITTRRLKPEWLHRKLEAARLSADVRCAYLPDTLPVILEALRRAESVGFVLDQYAHPPMGIPVPFFGIKVDTLAAVGTLAERYGAAVVPVSQVRDARGIVHVRVEPELELGAARRDPAKATEILSAKVEAWIRANPSQWLWVHRRFKNVRWPEGVPA